MVERLADLVAQIQNVRQLEAVVTGMRGIAASRAQKGRSLLPGVEAYARVVSAAIGEALSLLPPQATASPLPRHTRLGLILFCAEQGFAGALSEHVLAAAGAELRSARILLIGTRGKAIASERGVEAVFSAPMVTHVDAIPAFANRLADALYGEIASRRIENADILFSRSQPGRGIVVDRHSLLPLVFGRFAKSLKRNPPLVNFEPRLLLERLAAEYVFAQLCQAATHAFEAENEARMLAMASAKTNVETTLAGLSQRERQLRQEEITTEIVELAAGFEAARRGGAG
jgi:F-type H+-transporting ATPase subunit gamma